MNTWEDRDSLFKNIKAICDSHDWHMGSKQKGKPTIKPNFLIQLKLDVQSNNQQHINNDLKINMLKVDLLWSK